MPSHDNSDVRMVLDPQEPPKLDVFELRALIATERKWHGGLAIGAGFVLVGAALNTIQALLLRIEAARIGEAVTPAQVIRLADDAFFGWMLAAIGMGLFFAACLRQWRILRDASDPNMDFGIEEESTRG